jgi:hypothetical protein
MPAGCAIQRDHCTSVPTRCCVNSRRKKPYWPSSRNRRHVMLGITSILPATLLRVVPHTAHTPPQGHFRTLAQYHARFVHDAPALPSWHYSIPICHDVLARTPPEAAGTVQMAGSTPSHWAKARQGCCLLTALLPVAWDDSGPGWCHALPFVSHFMYALPL